MMSVERWTTVVRRKIGPSARRATREVRVRSRRLRGALPDVSPLHRDLSLDTTPAKSPSAWWQRETARLEVRGNTSVRPRQVSRPVDVAVLCVTNRSRNIASAIDNIARQTLVGDVHAVIVLNETGFDVESVERGLHDAGCRRVTVMWVPPEETLGACLRQGLGSTNCRYVAKFDDDDTYGPRHLEDSIAALQWSGAAVVGKHSHLVHLEETGETLLRFPGREWCFVGFVAGGTIVMDREATAGAAFGDGNTGEDTAFLTNVERNGGLILATSALGYVQFRGDANTWHASPGQILADSVSLGHGDLRSLIATG